MKNSKYIVAIALAWALLMVSSPFAVMPSSASSSTRVDPVTGKPYGDLSQYTWIGDAGTWSGGEGPNAIKYSAGPAPSRPDVLWNLSSRADIGTLSAVDTWAGGYVIVRSTKAGVSYINALHPLNGSLAWQIRHPSSGAITVLSDKYFKVNVGSGANLKWMVFKLADGTFAYNTTTGVPGSGTIYRDVGVLYALQTLGTGNKTVWRLVGYNISNPQQGVPVIWNISANWGGGSGFAAGGSLLASGDGKIFYGSWADYYIIAIDAKTGKVVWNTTGKARLRDGIYYDGKLITSGVGTWMTAYDGATGKMLWEYDAGVRNYFANTGCAAYGLIFQHCMALPVGYFGAWDAKTGELVWKIPGWYWIGYFSPCVADGKVYMIISDGRPISERTAADTPPAFTACIDAFTGHMLWTVPFQMGATGFGGMPRVAYGCLWYTTSGPTTLWCISDLTTAPAWAMWRGNTQTPGVAVGQSGPKDISFYKWKYTTNGPITGSPVIADGKVYFGSHDQNIYCLDARKGTLIWKFPTNYKVRSTPAVVGGKVYTGADDGYIYCINATTGQQIWKKEVGRYNGMLDFPFAGEWQERSSPIVVGNKLYVGALDGKVYCLSTATGDIVWTYQTDMPIGGSAAYYNGVIYMPSVDMYLYALNATNGNLIWKTKVGDSIQYYTGMLDGTPLVVPSQGKVFIQSSSGYSPQVRAYWIANGTECRFANGTYMRLPLGGSTPAKSTPVWYTGLLYTVGYWRVQCWNVTSGIRLWQVYLGHQVFSSPAIADGIDGPKLYVTCEVGSITCIDISNKTQGKVISVFSTPGFASSSPAIWERKVYAGWSDYNLYCFDDAVVEETSITACLSTSTIEEGDSVTVSGQLVSPLYCSYTCGGVKYEYSYMPGLPNMPVKVSFGKGGKRYDVNATTDMKGKFTVTFEPPENGTYTVIAWFEGKDLISYSYNYAYSDELTLTVTAKPSTPPPTEEKGIPMEYIYAAAAIIIIIIIIAAAYLIMKKRK